MTESEYLKVRSDAVALNKASGVTIGNVKTQLPQGYEAHIRKVNQCQINFKDKTFVPDSGPLKGNTDCVMLGANDRNKYYAWYRKSMYYQNFWVDIKMTLAEFSFQEGAYFRFIDTGLELSVTGWNGRRPKWSFSFGYRGTGRCMRICNLKDIDLFQGIVLENGFGQVYAREEAVGNLKAAVVNGRNYYFDVSGKNQSDSDIRFMLSALIHELIQVRFLHLCARRIILAHLLRHQVEFRQRHIRSLRADIRISKNMYPTGMKNDNGTSTG